MAVPSWGFLFSSECLAQKYPVSWHCVFVSLCIIGSNGWGVLKLTNYLWKQSLLQSPFDKGHTSLGALSSLRCAVGAVVQNRRDVEHSKCCAQRLEADKCVCLMKEGVILRNLFLSAQYRVLREGWCCQTLALIWAKRRQASWDPLLLTVSVCSDKCIFVLFKNF